jgi:hypothetical protein
MEQLEHVMETEPISVMGLVEQPTEIRPIYPMARSASNMAAN